MNLTNSDDNETERYAAFGRAATIPGIQAAIDALQQLLDDIRIQVMASQGRAMLPVVNQQTATVKRAAALSVRALKNGASALTLRGTPRKLHPRDPNHPEHQAWVEKVQGAKKDKKRTNAQKSYWANMTPEERSAEIRRRQRVAKKNSEAAA